MTAAATVVIVTSAVFFAVMGGVALVTPAIVPRQFGMILSGGGDAGRAEVRAVYGGFGVAMAAVLAVALVNDTARYGVVLATGAALAGMAAGRVVSAVLGDRTRFYPNWFYFAVEAVAAAALFAVA